MKKRLLTFFVPVLALVVAGISFSSCSDKYYYEVGADINTKYFIVKSSAWVPSNVADWEYTFKGSDASFIDKWLLQDGLIHASIVFDDEFISLPFWQENNDYWGYETSIGAIKFTLDGPRPAGDTEYKVTYLWKTY